MKTILSFVLALFLSSAFAFGQNYHLNYNITISGDSPQMAQLKSMFAGSTMDVYSNDNFTRVDFSLGSVSKTTSIVDYKTNKTIVLVSGMSGKMAIKSDLSTLEAKKA